MRKKLFLASLFSFFLTAFAFAQTMGIKGTVRDETGTPVAGAAVTVKGTSKAVLTDASGAFALTDVASGSIITVSYVGYASASVPASASMNIRLTKSITDLNEVVVTALGIKKEKKALGYSTTEVKGSDLTQARSVDVSNSLAGKVAGLNVTSTATGVGGSSRITIRGNASLSANNQPLIVVDGIPFNNDNINDQISGASTGSNAVGTWAGADQGDGISSLNPDEIESITVLKGGTAAALYGSRAANGAIMVTTKSGGKKNPGVGIEVNSNTVLEGIEYKKFKDYQYMYGIGDSGLAPQVANPNGQTNSYGALLDGHPVPQYDGVSRPYSAVRDNLSKFYRTGHTFTNSVAFYGGSEKLGYRLSFSDLVNQSIVPGTTLNRQNFAITLNSVLSKRWSFQGNVKYVSERTHNRPGVSDSPGNPNYSLTTLPTSLDVNTLRLHKYNDAGNEFTYTNNPYVTNPWFATEDFRNNDVKDRWITSFQPKFNITDQLYVKGIMGFDQYAYQNTAIIPSGTAFEPAGTYNRNLLNFKESNIGGIIGYDTKSGSTIGVNAFVGGNLMSQSILVTAISSGTNGFNIPFFYDVSNITRANLATTDIDNEKRIHSVYGSVDLSFKDYLYLGFTARNDWFSALTQPIGSSSASHNSIFYPSVSLSFILSEALKLPDIINYLKVRGSWAQVGGDTDPYQLSLTYGLNGAIQPFGTAAPLGKIGPSSIPSKDLQPFVETTDEVGLEGRMINNRLGFDLAYYSKATRKDIISATVTATSGYQSAVYNVGEITNKGLEALVSYRVGNSRGFTWEPSYNIAYNKSEVVALFGSLTQINPPNNQARTQTAQIAQVKGLPYSQLQVIGYIRDPQGNVMFGSNGLPQVGTFINKGTGIAPVTMGLTNSFRYKNFTLAILMDARYGGHMFSGSQALAYRYGLAKETLVGRNGGVIGKGVLADGSPNTVAIPAETYYNNLYNFGEPFVYSSDFIKLRSATLEYSFPQSMIGKTLFKGASISIVGRNLWTIMKHVPNIDPESTYSNGNAQGLEFGGVPVTRTYGVNLNLKF